MTPYDHTQDFQMYYFSGDDQRIRRRRERDDRIPRVLHHRVCTYVNREINTRIIQYNKQYSNQIEHLNLILLRQHTNFLL